MYKTSIFYTRILTFLSCLLFPLIYLGIFIRKMTRREGDSSPRILIVPQLTRIGDIVCSTPLYKAIKEKYPDSRIVVLSSRKASDIIKNNPKIDRILNIEDYKKNFLKLVFDVLEENFNYGISISGTPLSSILFFYGLIPNRIKITKIQPPLSEKMTDWMNNYKFKYEKLTYLPGFYVSFLSVLGIHETIVKKEVFWKSESDFRVSGFLEKKGVVPSTKLAGISLTAGNSIKEWGDKNFMIVAKEIISKYHMKVLFLGGPSDSKRIEKVILELGGGENYINGSGLSLEDLPALMNKLSLFVSVDTGPSHIAEALEVPIVNILGPINDIEMIPKTKASRIVKAETVSPTFFAFEQTEDSEQMREALRVITPAQVLAAVDELVLEGYIK